MIRCIAPLLLFLSVGFCQTEKETSKKISAEFEKNYNSEEYQEIFEMFSDEMKVYLPIEQTTDFLKGLNNQAGKITSREFIKYENGTYASYKTTFERAILALNISLDKNSKINGLLVKLFKEGNLPKLERNQTKFILPFNNGI